MTEWIRVKDRMPEHEERVLVKFKYKRPPFFAVCIKYGPCFVVEIPDIIKLSHEDHKQFIFTKDKVTHWMPLPELANDKS